MTAANWVNPWLAARGAHGEPLGYVGSQEKGPSSGCPTPEVPSLTPAVGTVTIEGLQPYHHPLFRFREWLGLAGLLQC